jgi:hypothetical protein
MATYYVRKDGLDTNNGSQDRPVKTEAKAKQLATTNGDVIKCMSRGVVVRLIRNVDGEFVVLG